jgi:hypothetical protein
MKTTINIQINIFDQIVEAAKTHGITSSEMILLLISKIAADIAIPEKIGGLVKYQTRRKPKDWHLFHVQVREDMYEYWLDLRKLLKMSVSLILANAVKKFLNKPLKIKTSDNYLCKNYIIFKEVIDSVIIWKFIWGFPPNPVNLFLPE